MVRSKRNEGGKAQIPGHQKAPLLPAVRVQGRQRWGQGGGGFLKLSVSHLGYKLHTACHRLFPCTVHACLVASVVSSSLRPYGPWHARFRCPWDSPGENIGVGCQYGTLCQNGQVQAIPRRTGYSLKTFTSAPENTALFGSCPGHALSYWAHMCGKGGAAESEAHMCSWCPRAGPCRRPGG